MPKSLFPRTIAAFRAATIVLAALAAGGCASVGAPAPEQGSSDTLPLQPDGTRAWRDTALTRPGPVQVDPDDIVFAATVNLDDAQRQQLRLQVCDALRSGLQRAGLRVEPDMTTAGGLQLRVTISAVERANPALNLVTTALLFVPLSYGGMTLQIEALNALTGQRAAALAFSGRAGVPQFGAAFTDLGHAKAQADIAAERFAALLTDAPSNASPR